MHKHTEVVVLPDDAETTHPLPPVEGTMALARRATVMGGLTLAAGLPKEPSWDRARHWQDAAKQFMLCSLASQVMLGFELIALHHHFGVKNGSKTHLSQIGKGHSWVDLLEEELGIKHTTAYRFMEMAREVKSKKLMAFSQLSDWDMAVTPIWALPATKMEALENAVRRITTDKTQTDFMDELGLADSTHEAEMKGGDNQWRLWVMDRRPELLDPETGAIPRRGDVKKHHKGLWTEWMQYRLDEAKAKKAHRNTKLEHESVSKLHSVTRYLLETAREDVLSAAPHDLVETARKAVDAWLSALRKARQG